MWDGCVEIVHGFDTKDGCVVVGAWLLAGWEMVVIALTLADVVFAIVPLGGCFVGGGRRSSSSPWNRRDGSTP